MLGTPAWLQWKTQFDIFLGQVLSGSWSSWIYSNVYDHGDVISKGMEYYSPMRQMFEEILKKDRSRRVGGLYLSFRAKGLTKLLIQHIDNPDNMVSKALSHQ